MAPNSKKRMLETGSDEASVEGKKARLSGPKQSHIGHSGKTDTNGDPYWEISKQRRVTISSFRNKTLINIREYYEKDGQELPGKKVRSAPDVGNISLVSKSFYAFAVVLP